jgi:hypothetical protein
MYTADQLLTKRQSLFLAIATEALWLLHLGEEVRRAVRNTFGDILGYLS